MQLESRCVRLLNIQRGEELTDRRPPMLVLSRCSLLPDFKKDVGASTQCIVEEHVVTTAAKPGPEEKVKELRKPICFSYGSLLSGGDDTNWFP